jgi:DNA polymerase-3 subunit alpha
VNSNQNNRPTKFSGLHSHSGFSTFDGLGYPKEHMEWCIENGLDSWALTDHGHMNGFGYAYLYAKKLRDRGLDFKFIPGCEMYVHPDLNLWKAEYELRKATKRGDAAAIKKYAEERERIATSIEVVTDSDDEILDIGAGDASLTVENEKETKSGKFSDPIKRRHHLVVLPKTSVGLQRLFGLVSRGYLDGYYRYPRVDYRMLKEAAQGGHLMVSSACLGGPLAYEIFQHLQQVKFHDLSFKLLDDPNLMQKVMLGVGNSYDQLADAVGTENVWLELQFNKLSAQHLVNRTLIEFANNNGLKDRLVVTCDSHYARPEHWKEREIYRNLGWLNYKDYDPSALPQSKDDLECELWPKNAAQVWETYHQTTSGMDFYDDEVVCQAIERTHDIAHNEIGEIHPDCSMKLPSYVVPAETTANKALLDMCKQALKEKGLDKDAEYVERTISELKIIKGKDFAEYFLTMKKIIDIAWRKQLVGPGRGSGAGSLVNYLLGITNVDPLEYNLLFERFLDPLRSEYPDIDTDVSDRDELIEQLREEFGTENVVPISNYNTFKIKSLIKDVSRFYGVEFKEVNSALSTLERDVARGRRSSVDDEAGFDITLEEALKYSSKTRDFLEKYPEILEPINVLFKQNKSLGRHAGGVIVSEDIANRMPLILAKGEVQTPWIEGMTAKHLETFGWVKFDLLGLETLRMIETTIRLILKKEGNLAPSFDEVSDWYKTKMDPKNMDLDDQRVYQNVYHYGRFAGIFQCTQKGAQRLFQKAKPESIIDIATLTSIYRPGPLSAKVDKIYINAKKNPETVDYGHDLVKQVLEPSYGCLVFQEQAMALCNIVAGIPKIELNKIRKMMKPSGSSDENVVEAKALRERFVTGAVANGIDGKVAKDLYEKILYFSGYGFNASHAVSYAIISYYCAWFLTYHEEEWLTAYLEAVCNNPKKLSKALSEVKSLGYKISGVDINKSDRTWVCTDDRVLVPSFSSCKGIGDSALQEILQKRPYNGIMDLLWNPDGSWKHSKLNKRAMSVLIRLRAFESVEWSNYFNSYKHFHDVVIDNWNDLKKSTKKDPYRGQKFFKEKLLESEETGEWTMEELAAYGMDLLGTTNVEMLLPSELLESLHEKGIRTIDECGEEDIYWMLCLGTLPKKTKHGKHYLIIEALGTSGKKHKIFCWNAPEGSSLRPYSVLAAQLQNGDYGFSTNWRRVRELGNKN